MTQKPIKTCTTILAGKDATIDGSTMIARNEDGGEQSNPQRFVVVQPEDQPKTYQSKISGVKIELPKHPLRYTSTPDFDQGQGMESTAGQVCELSDRIAGILTSSGCVQSGSSRNRCTTQCIRCGVLRGRL